MKELIRTKRKLIDTVIIILVASILAIPLLNSKLNVYQDDGIQHIARAYGTFLSLKSGNFLANVIPTFTNNFGYSWNLFYGPISTWGITIFSFITQNFIVGYKIVCYISIILSGIFMYKFMFALMNNKDASLLASILYMTFPYHLTDLYTRNAIGEFISFIFVPIVFLGLYNIFFNEDNPYYLAIGTIGLILTHNLSTLMVGIFAFLYFVFNIKKLDKSSVKRELIINIIIVLIITSFFWIPMVETKVTTSYQVYEKGAMATSETVANCALKIRQLFVTFDDGEFVFELGLHIIVMFAFSIMTIRRINEEFKGNYIFFIVASILSLWMSTKYFPWKYLPESFCIIQFPWRFLELSAFFLSIVCSINMYAIIKKFDYKDVCVISLISIIYICGFVGIIPEEENMIDIKNLELGKSSGREYETVAGVGKFEYLPTKAYNNKFYIATREDNTYVLTGKAIIENEEKQEGKYTADFETLDAQYTIFELPYIYYPGYEVRLDGIITEYFETENGFIGIAMGANDKEKITVQYKGTKLMNISCIISLISTIGFIVFLKKKY